MTWTAWRLQRTETLIAAAIIALLAALLIPTGINMTHYYHHLGLSSCTGIKGSSVACTERIGDFQTRFESLSHMIDWFTLIPGVIGMLLAAPFIFDLEHGTYRLAWTQSITRRRWLVSKLGLPIALAVVAAGAMILLLTWWRSPDIHLNGRLGNGTYDAVGTVPIGYTLFALGLALALGAVWRRAAASITVAFVGYFVMRIVVDSWLRDKLVTPLTTTWKGAQPARLNHAQILSQTVVGHPGVVLKGPVGAGTQLAAPRGRAEPVFRAVYHPANHFWPLQLIETGLFIGLAVLLIAFAAWWTHERTV